MKGKAVIWVLLCVFLIVSVNGSVIAIEDETGVKDKDEQTVEKENVPIVENIPFEIKAKSALLMCANTGEIIFEMNSDERRPIASITKIMTMLLVMEAIAQNKISLDDVVVASEHAAGMGGSQVYLAVGEEFTVHDLLKAVAIHSANDASVALAEHVAGSEGVFVTMMNEKARELGMTNTNFLDCSGLTDEGHYSTARDIAIMARELITKYPLIIEYTTIKHDTFRNGTFDLDNTNHLIGKYRGMTGLKTGVTNAAGYCLTATASRDGLDLISVILGAESMSLRFSETTKMLDYGFSNYEIMKIERKGETAGKVMVRKGLGLSVPVAYEDNKSVLLKRGQRDKVQQEVRLPEYVNAPVSTGDRAGEVVLTLENKEILSIPLIVTEDVQKASWFKLFLRLTVHWFSLARR
ncbi:MAG: D-alanyl-D-alanine carboxypeptidase [Clostridiaceae bacterium]|nr:D-alanyl-D-alanine carboxypeptidase [Clostridiaceae bacterium]